jgi:hypothetical protein
MDTLPEYATTKIYPNPYLSTRLDGPIAGDDIWEDAHSLEEVMPLLLLLSRVLTLLELACLPASLRTWQ